MEARVKRKDAKKITSSTGYAVPSFQGVDRKRFLLNRYLIFFILGLILVPEGIVGLIPGFLLLLPWN